MISSVVTSATRTVAAYLIAWLLSLPFAGPVITLFGVTTETARDRLTAGAVVVFGTVYYIVVRALEEKWPIVGVLLGVPAKPSYDLTLTPTEVATTVPASDPVSQALALARTEVATAVPDPAPPADPVTPVAVPVA